MLDFRLLKHFCAIVTEGQISRAAQRLNITQPTLSLSLKELETILGQQLINRAGGKWQVTEQGRMFYNEAQKILALMENLDEKMRNPQSGKSVIYGEVRIGCSGFCISFIRDILATMLDKYPGLKVRMLVADNVSLENRIQERLLDLAIIQLPLIFENCDYVALAPQRFVACWSPLLPVPPEGPTTLEAVARHPLMISRRWANIGAFRPLMIAMQKNGISPQIMLDTPFATALPEFLYSVPAVAVVPLNEVSPRKKADMPIREIAGLSLEFSSAIIWHKYEAMTPQTETVIDLICQSQGIVREIHARNGNNND